ncbi:hypothetical protein Tdes44962_MAKER01357 [Teratosphaeria destructans]|uniref:Uncharacterized protein n=1 Tax=Teratosphaeria destructans TaxID=418781 RepID=A0A9W7T0F3_9PEZI|nr:hypothetical protein Tdes44962_MAKER01357 [Teratosphaeria destructans]
MAPDVNSLPASPRQEHPATLPVFTTSQQLTQTSNAQSRRTSSIMPPPPPPPPAHASASAVMHRSPDMSVHEPGVPMRHPRPLTAAELYLECEKEQEAVVNRLTRELTALRAQSASVASNASQSSVSTNASLLPVDINDTNPAHHMTGHTHPTPSRRPRTSSSASTRSIPTPSTSNPSLAGSNFSTQVQAGSSTSVPIGGVSQASADRAAALGGANLSRRTSMSLSGASTPARQSIEIARHGYTQPGASYTLPHRPSLSRDPSYGAPTAAHHLPSPAPSPGVSVHSAMQHYADATAQRTEMETVKAENEVLKQRVRALERALRQRRRDSSQSDATRADLGSRVASGREGVEGRPAGGNNAAGVAAWAAGSGGVGGVAPPRERSESQSTTASSRRGTVHAGIGDDEVRVGESAGSVGVGRGL